MSKASNLAGFVPSIGPTNNLSVGVVTATSLVGSLTGNVTGNATGLSGTPNITVGVITATSFVGDGSQITNLTLPASFNELDAALFN
jgi:hypothetical protein